MENSLTKDCVHNFQDIIQEEVNNAPDGEKQNNKFEKSDNTGFLLGGFIFPDQRFPFLRSLEDFIASRAF